VAATLPRRTTGRFLSTYRARVIEQDDLVIVEFIDRPWFTDRMRRQEARRTAWCQVLRRLRLI
jgi:hypothetical protein